MRYFLFVPICFIIQILPEIYRDFIQNQNMKKHIVKLLDHLRHACLLNNHITCSQCNHRSEILLKYFLQHSLRTQVCVSACLGITYSSLSFLKMKNGIGDTKWYSQSLLPTHIGQCWAQRSWSCLHRSKESNEADVHLYRTVSTYPTVMSKMLLPTELDTAMSPSPFRATMTLVIRSGMEVPAAKMVRPIISSLMPIVSPT